MVIDLPQAQDHAPRPGQEQRLGEAEETLTTALLTQAGLASTQRDQLGVELPGAEDLFGGQFAVVDLLASQYSSQRIGQLVTRQE